MDIKRKIVRCLQKMTCDKHELHRFALKIKKRLDEACACLGDGKKK
ncbi:MAG: hypothetical protein IJ374_09760 [Lachnospiraceae bacterium]|nr:hypothetical protein [Lachnospiraceae bacterium]